MKYKNLSRIGLLLTGVIAPEWNANAQVDVLPSIPKGTIAISLQPVATGLGAPDYAISAPNDPSRLFVLEQKGTILVVQNGTLLPGPLFLTIRWL